MNVVQINQELYPYVSPLVIHKYSSAGFDFHLETYSCFFRCWWVQLTSPEGGTKDLVSHAISYSKHNVNAELLEPYVSI